LIRIDREVERSEVDKDDAKFITGGRLPMALGGLEVANTVLFVLRDARGSALGLFIIIDSGIETREQLDHQARLFLSLAASFAHPTLLSAAQSYPPVRRADISNGTVNTERSSKIFAEHALGSSLKEMSMEDGGHSFLGSGILDALSVGVLVTRDLKTVEFLNKSFHSLLGCSATDDLAAVSERITATHGFSDGIVAQLTEMITAPDSIATHLEIGGLDSEKFIELHRLNLADGGVVFTATDVTQQRRFEHALQDAKENAEGAAKSKSIFLANMSHELRTPLNAIIGFAEIMRDELFGPMGVESYQQYMRDIHESAHHLLAIINDILDMSKAETGTVMLDREVIDLRAIAEGCMRMVAERAAAGRVRVTSHIPEDMPSMFADKRRIKQILLNLLSNAVKFTPEDGRVSLTAKILDDKSLQITIEDTGIGIPEFDIDRVMEPFGQVDTSLSRRFEGTGLGLPLTKVLVELHDGHLSLASVVDEGTTATALFPPECVFTSASQLTQVFEST